MRTVLLIDDDAVFRLLVARALSDAVDRIDFSPPEEPSCCSGSHPIAEREKPRGLTGWLRAKREETKETFTALGIVTRSIGKGKPLAVSPDTEKFAIEFLTDILVLYLIKMHWHLIMAHWIRNPWQYRSEWMATIYMIFLLVKSKKPKK